MDRVFLDGIAVTARHGALKEERLIPQQFEIDISVFGDFHLAGEQDLLELAVDYSELGALVVEVATSNSFILIEALAEAIAAKALEIARVVEVEVTVRKMRPPVSFPLNHAGVTIRRVIG